MPRKSNHCYVNTVILSSYETELSWQKILTFPKISRKHNGEYVCIWKPTASGSVEEVWNETVVVGVKGKNYIDP